MSNRTMRRILTVLVAALAAGTVPTAAQAQSAIQQVTTAVTQMMSNAGMNRRSSHDGALNQG